MTEHFKDLTLGVISHKRVWADPQGIKATRGFPRQIEELSQYFKRTVLVVPFEKRHIAKPGDLFEIENMEIIPLPYHSAAGLRAKLDLLTKAPLITRRIWRAYESCDVLHYRIPGYVGALGLLVHKLRPARPGFIWMGGDWPERIRQTRDTWPRRPMAGIVAWMLPWLIHDVPTFALGDVLPARYNLSNPYVHSTVSTIISAGDIVETNGVSLHRPARLLFVGRLAVEKGLRHLLEAMALCERSGEALELTIAGEGPEKGRIQEMATKYGLEDRVHFKGFIPLGDRLWKTYRQADIFVLPSLSEGQGKVLIEAMANGLVVIGTRVGGIPSIIEDNVNGLLVEPRSSEGIAVAIERILREPETRRRLIRNGLASARRYTIEEQTEQLIRQLHEDFQALGWR